MKVKIKRRTRKNQEGSIQKNTTTASTSDTQTFTRRMPTAGLSSFFNSSESAVNQKEKKMTSSHDVSNVDYSDDGQPSANLIKDVHRIFALIQQERHLAAYTLYKSTLETVCKPMNSQEKIAECAKVKDLFRNNEKELQQLKQHAMILNLAKRNANATNEWIVCHEHNGITSSYRREHDGSLSLKVEGRIEGLPLFEQVAVMREVDLYHLWSPFVTQSAKISQLGKLDQIGWFEVGGPLMMRDALYRAIGCDCMMESGEVIVVAQGIDDDEEDETHNDDQQNIPDFDGDNLSCGASSLESYDHTITNAHVEMSEGDEDYINNLLGKEEILDSIEMPPRPKGFNKARMKVKFFEAVLQVESPTTATTRIVSNIDLKLKFVPQSIIEFIMKRMCGMMVVKIQGAARKIVDKPETNQHAERIRNDSFYKHWLLPKFVNYCKHKGWDMPQVVALDPKYCPRESWDTVSAPTLMQTTEQDASVGSDPSRFSSRMKRTLQSKLKKLKRRQRGSSVGDLASVASAPATSRVHTKYVHKFSEKQQQRLEQLKALQKRIEKEPTAFEEMKASLRKPLKRFTSLGPMGHAVHDYSPLLVLPILFILKLHAFYVVPYEEFLASDKHSGRGCLLALVIMVASIFVHRYMVETLIVSTLDNYDLPIPRYTDTNESSTTRKYYIKQAQTGSLVFSASLAVVAFLNGALKVLVKYASFGLRSFYANVFGTPSPPTMEDEPFFLHMVQNTHNMMMYTSTFLVVACSVAVYMHPSKAGKPVKITHGKNSSGENMDEVPLMSPTTERQLQPIMEEEHMENEETLPNESAEASVSSDTILRKAPVLVIPKFKRRVPRRSLMNGDMDGEEDANGLDLMSPLSMGSAHEVKHGFTM